MLRLDADNDPSVLTETAYAKVNLALHVRGRRADGYHRLESLFAFTAHGDLLRAAPADDLRLTIKGPFARGLESGADNLVFRAAVALREWAGIDDGARLVLDKQLPVASGIGGGSADAAAALRLLSRLWGVRVDKDDLSRIALGLGSDVPACLISRTQWVGGRGEELRDMPMAELDAKPMLLVNPGIALSTGSVFARWDGTDRGPLEPDGLAALIASGRNDLEPAAISLIPDVAEVLAMLRAQQGVEFVRMSGSGATCFALFTDCAARDLACDLLRRTRSGWWSMATEIKGS